MHFAQAGRTIVLLAANRLATRSMPRRSLGRRNTRKKFWDVWAIRRSWISRKKATLQRALVAMIEAELVESAPRLRHGA